MRSLRGLLLACHPVPTVAVTLLATGLAVAWGRSPGGVALVAATVLSGQLAIGWCDDATDVRKDQGRSDKPIVNGDVPARTVAIAAVVAAVGCVPLSFANGAAAGAAHLVVLVSGLAYAVFFERTLWSWLPYALAFGALPAFVHLGLPGAPWPPWWVVVAGALLGIGAHIANVLPDLESDLAAGVRGWPQRLGARRSRGLAPWPGVGAIAVLVLAPGAPSALHWAGLAAASLLAVVVVFAAPHGRLPFFSTLALAAGGIVLLLL